MKYFWFEIIAKYSEKFGSLNFLTILNGLFRVGALCNYKIVQHSILLIIWLFRGLIFSTWVFGPGWCFRDAMWLKYILLMISLNASSTFWESRADVSMNFKLFFIAKATASSLVTIRKCFKSYLLPTRVTSISESQYFLSSSNHFSIPWWLNGRVMS